MATRRCKNGKLKNPVRTRTGGKRICKKKRGRKTKGRRKRKSMSRKSRRTNRGRKSFRLSTKYSEEHLDRASRLIKDLVGYVQKNFKSVMQDPDEVIPKKIKQIYTVLVPGIIPKDEEAEILEIGQKIKVNNDNGDKTNDKDIRRMMRILVKTRKVVIAYQ